MSIVVTIGTALLWHSYWALISGILTSRIVRTLFSYRMHAWRPRFTLSAWRALIGFSLWSWAISMAELVRDRIDMFVVGRAMSSTAVGIYAIGEEVALLPGTEIVLPLCRACFPAFAAVGRSGESVEDVFMRPVAASFLLTLPAGLGISLIADPLVRLLMGEGWTGAIPIIQLLGIGSAIPGIRSRRGDASVGSRADAPAILDHCRGAWYSILITAFVSEPLRHYRCGGGCLLRITS